MASATTKDKLEFVYVMAKHSDATLRDCQALMRYGSTYHRLMEMACNVPDLGPDYIRKVERIQKALRKLARSIQADVKMSGDPRGCTVKIVVRDGFTNDWGKEGICVPTA